MANQLARGSARITPLLSSRAFSASASARSQLTPAEKEHFYPKLGNRDIVGYGWNGTASYLDRQDFPCPAVRFRENTDDVVALREKEKGDWKKLSTEEKKALYRASFCQTYAEMKAPSGEWKAILAGSLAGIALTGWLMIWVKLYVIPGVPGTITEEWKEKQVEQMVRQGQGIIEGVSSKWDYDNNKWK